ncbi:ROK family protein [Enterococcus haemoperoxidus ATCC BAA-382]|uniref:ROK family protein n=1 Tax=Enterococcus haemoperoxidus ATCC BAA-382 TaxID=1158608 RepID=R2QS78_9ENTE|nr:ROK family protein [Enterococcus haemoperoxidus]EOH99387.1 ROK family protein [Enterococcus haemoperoxidus ATCC BAA-382]EOT62872.1 ROK family protein [Enterococcus haemoperoxidus ATCC BAA-382]OJG54771.1 ROK family protein [Enterococcus haemoperoxidus]
MAILAFDFGGSAVKYGVWNGQEMTDKGKFTTPKTWEEMKASLLAVFLGMEQEFEGVAFSAPGVVDVEKQMINGISAIPYIHRFNIFKELEELFNLPVAIENDANCAGMAEIYEGAAKGKKEVAFVVVGTGIGGAIFHNGQIAKGAHLYGGEFGLMYLSEGETFSKLGTAVQMAWSYCERKGVEKETFTGEDVFRLAENGDELAKEEVNLFYEYLTQGLFSIQFSLDPEMIVLGGGVSAKEGLLDEINRRMKEKLAHFELNDFIPQIVTCKYENDANLIGAAANFITIQKNNE